MALAVDTMPPWITFVSPANSTDDPIYTLNLEGGSEKAAEHPKDSSLRQAT